LRVAALVPCYNEPLTIGNVGCDFRLCRPKADIYVHDKSSTDSTAARASQASAIVRREELQGKGHVIRRMFADVETDVYVLVDGNDTYDAAAAQVGLGTRKLGGTPIDTISRNQTPPASRSPCHPKVLPYRYHERRRLV
jgi:hypothetical protein